RRGGQDAQAGRGPPRGGPPGGDAAPSGQHQHPGGEEDPVRPGQGGNRRRRGGQPADQPTHAQPLAPVRRNPSPRPPPRSGEGEQRQATRSLAATVLLLPPPPRSGEGAGGRGSAEQGAEMKADEKLSALIASLVIPDREAKAESVDQEATDRTLAAILK